MNVLVPLTPFVLPRHQNSEFNDDFSPEKEGTTSFYGWTILRGGFTIEKRKMKATATDSVAKANNIPNIRNYTIQFKVVRGSQYAGVTFRMQDADNYYMARYNANAGAVEIVKKVAGAFTTIASASIGFLLWDAVVEVSCIGSKLIARSLGKEASVTDTTFTQGSFGLRSALGSDYWEYVKTECWS